MSFISRLTGRLPAFVSGGVTVAALHIGNQYYKSTLSVPVEAPKEKKAPPIPWSDLSKYTKQPTIYATGDTIFSFGTASHYFFATRDMDKARPCMRWHSANPADCKAATQTIEEATKLFLVAITPHDDDLITFLDGPTGTYTWGLYLNPKRYSQAPRYRSLLRWMRDNVSASESSLLETSVVFGPGAACFARTAGICFRQDLPEDLERSIVEKQRSYLAREDEGIDKTGWIPRIVALGARQNYIAIWDDGRWTGSLAEKNSMAEYLDVDQSEVPIGCWENVVLNPHDDMDYFAVTKLGHIYRRTRHGMDFRYQAFDYMQLRAKEGGLTFNMQSSLADGEKLIDLTVSPDSNWTEEKLRTTLDPKSPSFTFADAGTYLSQLRKRWF